MTDAATSRQRVAQAKALLQAVLGELTTSAPQRHRIISATTRVIAQLARLEQRLSVRRPGRPLGRSDLAEAERRVALIVQGKRFEWREATGRQRASSAEIDVWLTEAIRKVERDSPAVRGRLDRNRIRSRLKRLVRRRLSRRRFQQL